MTRARRHIVVVDDAYFDGYYDVAEDEHSVDLILSTPGRLNAQAVVSLCNSHFHSNMSNCSRSKRRDYRTDRGERCSCCCFGPPLTGPFELDLSRACANSIRCSSNSFRGCDCFGFGAEGLPKWLIARDFRKSTS